MTEKGVVQTASALRSAFACPFCKAYSQMNWFTIGASQLHLASYSHEAESNVAESLLRLNFMSTFSGVRVVGAHLASCSHCGKFSLWVSGKQIHPNETTVQPPNPDLPTDIATDYLEAAAIFHMSPHGAAALLRLAVQKLCAVLGEKGKNINTDIGRLVAKGLNPTVQKALDVVRVTGNQAVHPGALDIRDNLDTATALFSLVNLIADEMISRPKQVDTMYSSLPESLRDEIAKRDAVNTPTP